MDELKKWCYDCEVWAYSVYREKGLYYSDVLKFSGHAIKTVGYFYKPIPNVPNVIASSEEWKIYDILEVDALHIEYNKIRPFPKHAITTQMLQAQSIRFQKLFALFEIKEYMQSKKVAEKITISKTETVVTIPIFKSPVIESENLGVVFWG